MDIDRHSQSKNRQAQRRADAEARQAESDKLTPQQRLANLDRLGLVATRERSRLNAVIAKAAAVEAEAKAFKERTKK